MAEGYPSKWAAAGQGLLQGMQAGVLMDTNIRAGNQQTLENKRYDVAQKTAADKQQWDRDMQLMGEVSKLKTPEQQMNLVKAYLARQPDSQFVKTLVEIFSNPNSEAMAKELKDAVDSGDAIKAHQLGANLGLPEAGIKVVLEQAQAQKEQTNLTGGLFLQQAIPQIQGSPDIQNQMQNNRVGLLAGAGKTGQDILKEEVKPETNKNLTDFEVFYRGYKKDNPNATDTEISRAADARGVKKAGDTAEARANRTNKIIQTDTGIVFVNPRTNETTFIKDEKGQQVYGKTPVEIKTSHKNLNDNIAAVGGVREIFNKGSVGPVTGRINKLGNKFFNDADFTILKNRVAQLRTIVYGFSGKQINETEQAWLKNDILPAIEQPDENFMASLNEFDTWVKRHKRLLEEEYPAMAQMGGQNTTPNRRATDKQLPEGMNSGWK